MNQHRPPELDMTIDGAFVSPPTAPITSRILMWAVVIAIIAAFLGFGGIAGAFVGSQSGDERRTQGLKRERLI